MTDLLTLSVPYHRGETPNCTLQRHTVLSIIPTLGIQTNFFTYEVVYHQRKTATGTGPAVPSIKPANLSIALLKTLPVPKFSLKAYLASTLTRAKAAISPVPPTHFTFTVHITLPISQQCRTTPLHYTLSIAVTIRHISPRGIITTCKGHAGRVAQSVANLSKDYPERRTQERGTGWGEICPDSV